LSFLDSSVKVVRHRNWNFRGGGLWKKDGGGAVEKIPRFGPLDWFAIMP
jgi:hypothetical protein